MFKTIANAWRIPDLRKKLLFTLLIIVVYRIGSVITVPFLDMGALASVTGSWDSSGSILAYLNTLSGGAFANATIFAMGITPYINSSIIMQLLTVAIPPLERLAKEGEEGRKKIATITRYVTVGLGLLQGAAYYWYLYASNVVSYRSGFEAVFAAFVIILTFTAGTALMMWLGEQINQYGIGNGISILLFAGIVARFPLTITQLVDFFQLGLSGATQYLFLVPIFVILFLAVIWVIVFMNDSERRIPVQYAKRVVGRKMYGGQSTHIPIKVNQSGVIPIIFALSLLQFPLTITYFFPDSGFTDWVTKWISPSGNPGVWIYGVFNVLLIIAFTYFYTGATFNPVDVANNMKANGGFIPGIRPGKATEEYLQKVVSRITIVGAIFLAVIATLPTILSVVTPLNLHFGGTSLLIAVGVALDTVRQLENQMLMRNYQGFLK